MGLEREGALADHPWHPFESIVTALTQSCHYRFQSLRPGIGPICALGGHCGLKRGTCCQSSGPAEVIVAQGYIFPLNVCPILGLDLHTGSVFQQIETVKSAESRKISDQEFRKTKNLVLGYDEN